MYKGPHVSVRINSVAGIASEIRTIQEEVPGVQFWCWPTVEANRGAGANGGKKMRQATGDHANGGPCIYHADGAVGVVPFHASSLYFAAMASGRYPVLSDATYSTKTSVGRVEVDALPGEIPTDYLAEDSEGVPLKKGYPGYLEKGRKALENLGVDVGGFYPHQLVETGLFLTRYSALVNSDPGTGKTVSGIGMLLARGAKRVLFLGLKSAKSSITGIPADMRRFFPGIEYKVVHPPKSPLRAKFGSLEGFGDGVAIVPMDNLGWYLGEIVAWKPDAVVFDEISMYASRDTVRASGVDEDGKTVWTEARTDKRGVENEALARDTITKLSSVKYRVGLTGTPLEDGDVSRWWAVLNLLDPEGFGYGSVFDKRYVGGRIEEGADGTHRRGATNIEELKKRLRYIEMVLPSDVALRRIPRSVPRLEWVEVEQQAEARGFNFAAEEKRLAKVGAPEWIIKSARAAARKEKVLFAMLDEGVKAGWRQVVFTSFIRVNQVWAEKAEARWGSSGVWVGRANAEDGDGDMDRFASLAADDLTRPAIIFVNIGLGGRGTNALVEAHRHVLAELTKNPGKGQQALGRSWRPKNYLKGVITEVVWLAARATVDEDVLSAYLESAGVVSQFSASEQHRVLESMIAAEMGMGPKKLTEAESEALAEAFIKGWAAAEDIF